LGLEIAFVTRLLPRVEVFLWDSYFQEVEAIKTKATRMSLLHFS